MLCELILSDCPESTVYIILMTFYGYSIHTNFLFVFFPEQAVSLSDPGNPLEMEPVLSLDDNLNNSSLVPVPSLSPSPKDNLVTFSSEATVSLGVMDTRSPLPEQTNVCKVGLMQY